MSNQVAPLDTLTGTMSRPAFEGTLNTCFQQAEAESAPFSFALVDIDHFKEINDELGHAAGDAILVGFADVLKTLGDEAIIARYGGDEFAILFLGMEREKAFLKLERIRETIEQKTEYRHGNYSIQKSLCTSIGVAAYPIDGNDPNELFRKADAALYRAKLT
jgi:diguanylate cyclase (GGDEF)-like protein